MRLQLNLPTNAEEADAGRTPDAEEADAGGAGVVLGRGEVDEPPAVSTWCILKAWDGSPVLMGLMGFTGNIIHWLMMPMFIQTCHL